LTKLTIWKTFSAEPFQIVNGQRSDIPTFVLAEWHPGANKFDEKI
jgi:hypothetical protein